MKNVTVLFLFAFMSFEGIANTDSIRISNFEHKVNEIKRVIDTTQLNQNELETVVTNLKKIQESKRKLSDYEVISIWLQALGLLIVIAGVVYAGKQLRTTRQTHQETLEWNKKIATENQLRRKLSPEDNKRLNDALDTMNRYDTIPLESIRTSIDKDVYVKYDIHRLLNNYESLAIGISHGIYNQQMIADSSKNTMIKGFHNFSEYIEERQTYNPEAWTHFQELIKMWESNPD